MSQAFVVGHTGQKRIPLVRAKHRHLSELGGELLVTQQDQQQTSTVGCVCPLDIRPNPRSRISPMAVGGCAVSAQCFGCFSDGHAGKIPKLNHLGGGWVTLLDL
jgi:hypothetical protein